MAELVDAADSKSAVRKDVQVRFLFWAPGKTFSILRRFFTFIDGFYEKIPCTHIIDAFLLFHFCMRSSSTFSQHHPHHC